jgi:thiol-disulfide isomerase/thioredoxin
MFIVIVGIVVVVMVGIVVATVLSGKKSSNIQSKIETSDSISVRAASVNGKVGESSLPAIPDDGSTDPAEGKIVPQITAQDFGGKKVTITPGTKPYVIIFVAHWCPHCQREVPKLVSMETDGSLPSNVEYVAIATSTDKAKGNYPPSKWLKSEGWPWRALADDVNNDAAQAMGVTGFPTAIYVNADGTIYKRTSGEVDESTITSYANAISDSATKAK